MNRIRLLKSIDSIAGKSLVNVLTKVRTHGRHDPEKVRRVLIIRPGGIGDAVLLLPSIDILKKTFPDAEIDVLCERRNAGIFDLKKALCGVYLYDRDFDLFRCRKNRYDVVIDTEQWHRLSAVVARMTGAPMIIGFETNERGDLFTHRIPYSHDEYEVYSFFRLIEPLIGKPAEFAPDEPFMDVSNVAYPRYLSDLRIHEKKIAIFPGASVRERKWGGDRFGKFAQALAERGYHVVILGSGAEKADAEAIRRHAVSCTDLTGRTSLRDVAALLKQCRLLITADSGLMHIAYGVGTPTVSLFGSGIEEKWAPRGKNHVVLNKRLPCSPCTKFGYTPPCKMNVECLSSISVDEVLKSTVTVCC